VSLQERAGLEEIVGVAVVERDGDGATGRPPAAEGACQIPDRQRSAETSNDFQVLIKMSWRDGELPGIPSYQGDPVIHEDDRGRRKPGTSTRHRSPGPGRSENPHGKDNTLEYTEFHGQDTGGPAVTNQADSSLGSWLGGSLFDATGGCGAAGPLLLVAAILSLSIDEHARPACRAVPKPSRPHPVAGGI
jgi:hypothetical protein